MTALNKVLQILSSTQKKSGIALLFLLLLGVIFEAFGIGLIVPVMGVILQDDFPHKYTFLENVVSTENHSMMIVLAMVFLVTFYLVKNLYLVFLAYCQARFVFGMQRVVSQKLFNIYLNQPYAFYLQRNSAQLIRNVTTEINHLSFTINACLLIASESLLILAVAVLLIFIEPVGASIVIFTLVFATFIFLKITKSKVLLWGERRQYHEGMRIQHLQQGLGGIKDVLLLGRSRVFQEAYSQHNVAATNVTGRQHVMQQLPRLWLEFLAILGLGVLVVIMVLRGGSIEMIFPTLGLFAASAFRLIPSSNRMIASIQVIRYGIPIINTIHNELQLKSTHLNVPSAEPMALLNEIEIKNLCFSYESSSAQTLNKINLKVRKGMTVGFIGESGSGKSTLIDCVMGLLEPSEGGVLIDSKNISGNLQGWQAQIGYVSQSIFLTDDTLRKNIAFGVDDENIDEDAVQKSIKSAQLDSFVASLPGGLDTIVGERGVRLSGGQRQRIAIARALYHDPSILVLDEATSALDNQTEEEVMSSIEMLRASKTVLIVAHRLNTVKNCDYIYKLDQGLLVDEGVPSKFIKSNVL